MIKTDKQNMRTWLVLDKKALVHNVKKLRTRLHSQQKFMAVVKANAYGHGLFEILGILESAYVDSYAVFDFEDAVFIRSKSKRPILVLCNTHSVFFEIAARQNIAITVSSLDGLQALLEYRGKRKLEIHIKVDTGLGRQGFTVEMFEQVKKILKKLPKTVSISGLYTHFSGTEEKVFDSYTKKQYENLLAWKIMICELGHTPLVHAGATSGSLRFRGFQLDIARFGIGMYGLWPSKTVESACAQIQLKPVLSWYTCVTEVKSLPKGSSIAYDRTHILQKDSTVALIPVGYYDGIPRTLSDRGYVLIHGKKAPILGRVMMNMIVVDVSNCGKVRAGDIVTIIGKGKKGSISLEEFASLSGTINYESVTRINPLLPRIVT